MNHKQRMRFHAALGGAATARKKYPFPRRWSPEETERALEMRASGMEYREIGEALGRSEGSISGHIKEPATHGKIHPKGSGDFAKPTEDMVSAQKARQDAYTARDLTATMCGDPPVGQSALDRYNHASLLDDEMRKRIAAKADD